MSESDDQSQVDQEHSGPDHPSAPEEQMLGAVGRLLGESSGLARDYLDLLAVEGQLAGRALVLMLALGVVLGLVLVAAWLFLGLAGAMWLVASGILTLPLALLVVALAQLVMAGVAWLAVRRLSRELVFGGLREALSVMGNDPGARS